MKYVRELNEGVMRIYESMEKSMLAKPEYYDRNNTITLILRNKVADHEKSIPEKIMQEVERIWGKLNETEKKVLEFIFTNHKGTVLELSQSIEVSDRVIRTYLNKFCDLNILVRYSKKNRDKDAIYAFKKS